MKSMNASIAEEGIYMLSPITITLLTIYSLIIVASYFIVRRGWLRAYPTFIVSFVVNALVLFSFSLARGNLLFQAVVFGFSMAIIFSALSVTIGVMFRALAPLPKHALVEKPALEATHQAA